MKHAALLLMSTLIVASCAEGLGNGTGSGGAGGAGEGTSASSAASSASSAASSASSAASSASSAASSASSAASSGAGGAGGGPANMVVQYKVEIGATSTAAIGSQFWIVNNSINQVNLNDLTLRYYFTNEVAAALIKSINWANVGALGGPNANFPPGDISVAVVPMAMPVASADTYVEFSFIGANDVLPPGYRLQFSWTLQNFMSQNFMQPGDYSFNAAAMAQMDWPKVVLLYKGQSVVWGVQP